MYKLFNLRYIIELNKIERKTYVRYELLEIDLAKPTSMKRLIVDYRVVCT